MHNTQLNLSHWEHGVNSFRESGEPINTGNENIFNPTVLKLCQHRKPEFGTFCFGKPKTQKFLMAFSVHAKSNIYGFTNNPFILMNLNHKAIEIQDGEKPVQRAILPCPDLIVDSISYLGYQGR